MYIVLKRAYKHFNLHALIEAAKQSSEVNFILGPLCVSEMSWLKIQQAEPWFEVSITTLAVCVNNSANCERSSLTFSSEILTWSTSAKWI